MKIVSICSSMWRLLGSLVARWTDHAKCDNLEEIKKA